MWKGKTLAILVGMAGAAAAIALSIDSAYATDRLYQWHPGYAMPIVYIADAVPYRNALLLKVMLVDPKGDPRLLDLWCPGKAVIVIEHEAIDIDLLAHVPPIQQQGFVGYGWGSGVIDRVDSHDNLTIVFVKNTDSWWSSEQIRSPMDMEKVLEQSSDCTDSFGGAPAFDTVMAVLHGVMIPVHPTPKPTPEGPRKVITDRSQTITGADTVLQDDGFENKVSPIYPSSAKEQGAEGQVVVKVELDQNGHLLESFVSTSSKNADLDSAALKAARKSTYSPGHAGWYQVTYTFSLGN